MLSIKCENCGANLSFEKDHIPGFCSFCGSSVSISKEMLTALIEAEENEKNRELEREKMKHEKKMSKGRTFRTFISNFFFIAIGLLILYVIYLAIRIGSSFSGIFK